MNAKATVYKVLIILLFCGLTIIEIKCHSERWRSFYDAVIFMSGNLDDEQRLKLISENYIYSTLTISILFLLFKNKWILLALLLVMLLHLYLFLPSNYINDLSESF